MFNASTGRRLKSGCLSALLCCAPLGWVIPASAGPAPGTVAAAGAMADWPMPGGDAGGSHHSALADISSTNVGRLGLAWSADLGTNRVLEATPVVIGGVMYTSGVAGRAYAFDAASGRPLWKFEPPVDMQVNRTACCDQANRGVAVAQGRVFVSALDGWLYALDAKDGHVLWKADEVTDRGRGYSSTGAPVVAGDVVVIGNGGSEYDVRGYLSAFDLRTGALRWRFWVVPHDPRTGPQETPALQRALKTWDPASRWDIGGGGAPWDALAYDPETGYLLVGTGNGGPYINSSPRGGDQLFLGSVVALDPKSGHMQWFYQETPGDKWDFTSTQPMILAHLAVDGKDRSVIIHAPKNGFLYLIDRRTGKLLRANPIVRVNWARAVDLRTGRPVLTPQSSDYTHGPQIVFPSTAGARNWYPASFDPDTGLYVASVLDMANLMMASPGANPHVPRTMNTGASLIFSPDIAAAAPGLPAPLQAAVKALPAFREVLKQPFASELRAIDPVTGRTRWAVPMRGWQDRGGVLTTGSGLVFQGSIDGTLRVFDERDGRLLKSIDTGTSILAAPMTYRVGGVQYVSVMAGWGGGGFPFVPPYSAAYARGNADRILTFRLGGGAVPIPPPLPPLTVAPAPPAQAASVTRAVIAHGRELFTARCAVCHANQPRSITPDLRRMQPGTHAAFRDIVLHGLLVPAGMPRWDDLFSAADVDAIHAYLIDLQGRTRADELAKQKAGLALDAPSPVVMSNF